MTEFPFCTSIKNSYITASKQFSLCFREEFMSRILTCVTLLLIIVGTSESQTVSYSSHVRPIFDSYGCLDCHGGSGGLFLGTYSQVFATGDHSPVVVAGDTNSVLVLKLKGTAGFGSRMPPQGGGAMAAADLNTIVTWIKNGALENPTTVRNEERGGVIPTYALYQNYPNPFNPATRIQFSIPKSGNVRMTLHDAVGKEIAVLIDRQMSEGAYSYDLDASRLPSGVYLYRIAAGNTLMTKKMMLIK
jgi:hypothetical protein